MPSTPSSTPPNMTEKVSVSFSNWVLGGSLVSMTSVEEPPKKKTTAKKVVIIEVDEDGNEIRKKSAKDKDNNKDRKSKAGETKKKENVDETCKDCGRRVSKHKKHSEGEKNEAVKEKGDESEKEKSKNDNLKKDEAKAEEPKDSNTKTWTSLQDEKILELKAQNKSWKDIAYLVAASKHDVQERFKTLKAKEGVQDSADKGDDKSDAEGTNADDEGGFGFDDFFEGDNTAAEDNGAKDKNENKGNGKKNQGGNNKQQQKGQNQKQGGGKKDNQHDSYNSNNQSDNNHQGQGGNRDERAHLRANQIWDQEDCEILEYLEARYQEHKWLHMQASFFNWTGRMIPAGIIENKFKDDGLI